MSCISQNLTLETQGLKMKLDICLSWMLKQIGPRLLKGHNLGLSLELEASPVTALLSKFTANIYLWFWLWSQGSPRDSAAMLLAWSFQDQVLKTCVTIVYAKESLELTAGLQMGSHNGACIRPQAFTNNQGQCCIWPRALKLHP